MNQGPTGLAPGVAVVDVDSHFYEPAAIWERYVAPDSRSVARTAFWHGSDDRGNRLTVMNGSVAKELSGHKLVRHAIWRPGTTPAHIGALDPDVVHPLNPGASEVAPRLADMDALGIDQAVVYPTLFAEYFPLIENPIAADILARAYNDWSADIAAESDGRLHPVAILPMQSLLLAQRELDRIAEKGFRGVFLRPMLYTGDATADPPLRLVGLGSGPGGEPRAGLFLGVPRGLFVESGHFRPLWAQIDDLGLVACVHPSVASTNPEGTSTGTFIERVARPLGIGHSVAESTAYIQDNAIFLTAAIFHGLLEDLPTLKIATAHGGANMLPLVAEKAETYLWLGGGLMGGTPVCLEPEEVLEAHPLIVSFDSWESSVARMPDLFAGKVGWGSRYPHHDAASPAEAIALLDAHGVDRPTMARMMGGNAAELFGLAVSSPV